mgnify:CR=1 FL=1
MFVDPSARPTGLENTSFYHPVFLYESLLLLAIYLYLIQDLDRIKKNGAIFLLIGYPLVRIIVEFFRIDYTPIFGPFDLAQLVSFGIIVITLTTLTFRQK